MWYVYTMEYYSAIKINDLIKFLDKWMKLLLPLLDFVLFKKQQSNLDKNLLLFYVIYWIYSLIIIRITLHSSPKVFIILFRLPK